MADYGLTNQDKKLLIDAQKDIALGQALLDNYLLYVSYFFFVQYGTHMKVNRIHREIAEFLDAVVRLEVTRGIINVAPRVGKTELISIGFPAYGFAYNPKSKFICTSYADRLVNANSEKTKALIQTSYNPDRNVSGHSELFPNTKIAIKKTNTKDEWYTTEGGGLYAVPLGGQITGFGAGNMDNSKFSGAILIDDPLKPSDANSDVLREKVNKDFIDTLYSRRNHANTPIVLIMQRLHENDLSGFLLDGGSGEQWDLLKIPVLEDEKPIWGWRYSLDEINKLRRQNPMTFSGQYMQEPAPEEGTIIKVKEFREYHDTPQVNSKVMVVDGAWEEGTMNDYTVFDIWGERGSECFLLDKKRFKAEFADMYIQFLEFYKKHLPKFVIIEKKASGIALISMLKKEHNIPFVEYETGSTSKADRMRSVAMFIPQGKVHIPSQRYLTKRKEIEKGYDDDWLCDFIKECKNFPVGKHDDSCFVAGTKISTIFGDKNIEDIKCGDLVITPFGLKEVIDCGLTQENAEVIEKLGLKCTPYHKIFNGNSFDEIISICNNNKIDALTMKGLLQWRYKKLLYSMEYNIGSWGRESIILVNQRQITEENVLKDCMLQFGNFIADKKFLKAMWFIIKTAIILIMSLAIWNVFLGANILRCIVKILAGEESQKLKLDISKKLEIKLLNGMHQKKEENGIENTLKKLLMTRLYTLFVQSVAAISRPFQKQELLAQDVVTSLDQEKIEQNILKNIEKSQEDILPKRENVYNLTVKDTGCYYANGILVSNCDTLAMMLQHKYLSEKGQVLYTSFSRDYNVARLPIIGYFPIDVTFFISQEGVNVCMISQFNANYQLKVFDCIVDETGNVSLFLQTIKHKLQVEYGGLKIVVYSNIYHDAMDEAFNGDVDTIKDALNDKECFDIIEKNFLEFVKNEQGLRESKFTIDLRADKLINAIDGGIRYEYKEQGIKPTKVVQRIKPFFQINECLNLLVYKKFIEGYNNIVAQSNIPSSQQIRQRFTLR